MSAVAAPAPSSRDDVPTPAADPTPSAIRSRVLAATVRLIREGSDRITIQDVVKESGVALQTFYRSFNGKDDLLLAAIAEMIRSACDRFRSNAEGVDDPIERLRCHIASVVGELHRADDGGASARFIASERTRLAGVFPDLAQLADQPVIDLFEAEIAAANRTGQASSSDPARDAFFITQLVMSVYRRSAFTHVVGVSLADDVFRFCLHGVVAASGAAPGAANGD